MTVSQLNYLNIGLMLLSAALAYAFPFEVFVLAYVLLGPLHYFTEILWLRQRNFFTTGKRDAGILIALGALIFAAFIGYKALPWLQAHSDSVALHYFVALFASKGYASIILMAFAGALSMVLTKNWRVKIGTTLTAGVVGWFAFPLTPTVVFLALLPSIIHVFGFTFLFVIGGAKRAKGPSGWISSVVMVMCAVILLFAAPVNVSIPQAGFFGEAFAASDFARLKDMVATWLAGASSDAASSFALRAQAFIAFAYLYHYLNWFSKTGVIGWHKVKRPLLIGAVILWVGTISLWFVHFVYGFTALFFLSMLHVFLEFPLNHRSILELIGLKSLAKSA